MTARTTLAIASAAAALLVAGCVREDGFPTLAPRPEERDVSTEAPVREPVEVPGDPALRRHIAELERQAAEGDQAFDAAFGPAEAAVNAAGPRDSDSWIEAQQALSRLEVARVATMSALRELDQLSFQRADIATSGEDFAAVGAAIATAEAIAARQQDRWDRLRDRLGAE